MWWPKIMSCRVTGPAHAGLNRAGRSCWVFGNVRQFPDIFPLTWSNEVTPFSSSAFQSPLFFNAHTLRVGVVVATQNTHPSTCNKPMITSSNGNIFRVTGPLCGEFTGPGEFPTQKPVTRNFDVFFYLRLNKRLSKQPWGCWFETPSWSLWRQCNATGCRSSDMSGTVFVWDRHKVVAIFQRTCSNAFSIIIIKDIIVTGYIRSYDFDNFSVSETTSAHQLLSMLVT